MSADVIKMPVFSGIPQEHKALIYAWRDACLLEHELRRQLIEARGRRKSLMKQLIAAAKRESGRRARLAHGRGGGVG